MALVLLFMFVLQSLPTSLQYDKFTGMGITDADFGDYVVTRLFINKYKKRNFWERLGNYLGFFCAGVPPYNYHKIKELKDLWQIASQENRSILIDPQTRVPPWIFTFKEYIYPYFYYFLGVKEEEFRHVKDKDTIDVKWFLSYMWNWILCDLTEHSPFLEIVYDKMLDGDTELLFDLTDLLTRYYLCVIDLDAINNCPGACNGKKNPCTKLKGNDGTCTSYLPGEYSFSLPSNDISIFFYLDKLKAWIVKLPVERRIPAKLYLFAPTFGIDLDRQILFYRRMVKLQKLVVMDVHCRCTVGYVYDTTAKNCKSMFDKLLCGSGNPCKNGGACARRLFENGSQSNDVQCDCHPAFQGQYCERKRNPCRYEKAPCDRFPCLRDETAPIGYRCRCPRGYKTKSRHQPQCEDEDDCLAPNTCQNGGTCINRVGTFDCECRKGFEGFRCEIPPPPPEWTTWSEWSNCVEPDKDHICDELPYQEQLRMCQVNIIQQRCLGPRRRIRYGCKGKETIDTNLHCAKDASEIKSFEIVDYARVDDAGLDESDPPIATRDSSILPAFGDTFFYTIWLALVFIQVYVVWLWSSFLVNFIRPKE